MPVHRLFFMLALVATLLVAVCTNSPAQQASTATPVVGILPLDDGTGKGMSVENAAAFAKQLRAALLGSAHLTPQLINLRAGTALPLEPRQAAEVGRAARVDVILAATLLKAETKQSDKGLRGLGGMLGGLGGVSGGARVQSMSAEVKLQVELISATDARRLDTFGVEGKKSDAKVSGDVYTGVGSTDISSPGFQNSPLGQALQQAVQNLAAQLEKRAGSMPATAAAHAPAPSTQATEGAALLAQGNAAGQAGEGSQGERKPKKPCKEPCAEGTPSRKEAAEERPAPEVYRVKPDTAPPGGVGEVVLSGSNLTPDLRVQFDCNAGIKGTFKVESSSRAVAKIRVPLDAAEQRCPIALMRLSGSKTTPPGGTPSIKKKFADWDRRRGTSGSEMSSVYAHGGARGYGGADASESSAAQGSAVEGSSHGTDESEIGESESGSPEVYQLATCNQTSSNSWMARPVGAHGRFMAVALAAQTCTLAISESAMTMPVAVPATLLGEGDLDFMALIEKMQGSMMNSMGGFGEKGEKTELLLSTDSVKFMRGSNAVLAQPTSAVKSVDEMKMQGQSMGIFRIAFKNGKTYNFMQMGGPEGRGYKIVKRRLGK